MRLHRVVPALLVVAAAACAGRPASPDTAPRRERNIMQITEIQEGTAAGLNSVYDLITRNHPEWLRETYSSMNGGTTTPTVWMDSQRYGTLSALQSIPLRAVTSVRMLSPSEARGELGLNNPAGAILVSTH